VVLEFLELLGRRFANDADVAAFHVRAEEAADVLYHLAVLLRSRGLALADAEQVLAQRRGSAAG